MRDPRERRRRLWSAVAFAARYGSCSPMDVIGRTLDVTELEEFNNALANILREESEAIRKGTDG